ncbi:MAG: phosphoenolpyruvate synthase [Candidatus Nanohalarchaeota archaeon]|nr:MAG: phosphoenolpyruvate synthase [Candidatus Nanohaloarchaeota archaeon]
MEKDKKFILWFDQLGIEDVGLVGGKNASLGEMYKNLTPKGIKIPNGFAITAHAYRYLIEKTGIEQQIRDTLKDLDTKDMNNLMTRGQKVRSIILNSEFPQELKDSIKEAYGHISKQYGQDTDVAVRSSATAEDLPDASFAGQQETYLNIVGPEMLIEACKKCFASLFTNRAISYRTDKNFDHFTIALSIGVQKMVRSDLATSGVMFSIDTESGFQDAVFITGAYGLGENVVQGAVNPDEYYVFKPTLKQGKKAIISKTIGSKEIKMIYTKDGSKPTKNIKVPDHDQKRFCLNDDEIITLAKYAIAIEDHYSKKAGHFKPMDMEWAKDGSTGELFIVQARPETVHSQEDKNIIKKYILKEQGKVIIKGESVGELIGAGQSNIILDVHDITQFKKGQVLVTDMTDPDWEPIMKIASAIVTNRGGRTCHAAIISRELGIPCVVGTIDSTKAIKNKQDITVSCASGEIGYVYNGKLKYVIDEVNLATIPTTKTKIMMNLATPSQAFEMSFIPNEGVGLAREEFIINTYIRIHPLALMYYKDLKKDQKNISLVKQIDGITQGYPDKKEYFIEKLAHGIATIAAAFYPKDVIVRLSDFKSNEYANLIGGTLYEPTEDNPMIGWRGASRYYSDKYCDAFGLECKALKRVRDDMGLTNVKIMIPFCRTVEEGKKVLAEMEKHGLKRGKNNLEIYVMCEIPSNVILVDEFSEIFDGFSIGSNDLTQLTLGVDRDSELVSHVYDERNAAVKKLIIQVIAGAKRNKRKIGICGQAPSDFPDFAEFLVEHHIDSISLNPDTVIKTRLKIAKKEKSLKKS